jgi:phosphohistidine phosphatase
MRFLTLLRHGAASYESSEMQDLYRPLSPNGVMEAELMARSIAKLEAKPDLMITSNALRTMNTAKIIIEKNNWQVISIENHPELYLASLETLIDRINSASESIEHLLLINHNPGLSELANHLIPSFKTFMPTCSCLSIKFKEDIIDLNMCPQIECYRYDYPSQYI